jgi:hypothetical protein
MTLDKRTLSSLDRKMSAELDSQARFRMVRVPIDDRRWAIWNRYCQAAGVSMGRGIAGLIEEELASVVTGTSEEIASPLVMEAEKNVATQQAGLAAVEKRLAHEATRLQQWERQLEYRRNELRRKDIVSGHPHHHNLRRSRVHVSVAMIHAPAGPGPSTRDATDHDRSQTWNHTREIQVSRAKLGLGQVESKS